MDILDTICEYMLIFKWEFIEVGWTSRKVGSHPQLLRWQQITFLVQALPPWHVVQLHVILGALMALA